MDLETLLDLGEDVIEVAGLDAARGGLRVAVHRVAAPQHRLAAGLHGLDQPRQVIGDAADAKTMRQRQAARLVVGMQDIQKPLQPLGRHARADFDGDGVSDAAAVLHVRPVEVARTHADPGQVRGEVVPALPARHLAGLGLLVGQVHRIMAREEIDASDVADARPGQRLQEPERLAQRFHHSLVLRGSRRVLHETEVPVFRMVQVGKAAVDQTANEVERQRRALIAAKHELRIGLALLGREADGVDQVTAVARQRDVAPRLDIVGARLGVLAGEAAHANDGLVRSVNQHQAHLEEDLELAGDDAGFAFVESLGAIPALEQEPLPAGDRCQLAFQGLDLPRGHQRRQRRELLHDAVHQGRTGVDRLLLGRLRLPGCGCPVHGDSRPRCGFRGTRRRPRRHRHATGPTSHPHLARVAQVPVSQTHTRRPEGGRRWPWGGDLTRNGLTTDA
jgi:hypothetical protein